MSQVSLSVRIKMLNIFPRGRRNQIILMWVGIVGAVILSLLMYFYENPFQGNTGLSIALLFFSIPTAITYMTLAIEICSRFKFKTLVLVPVLMFPRALVLFLVLLPVIYLGYITYEYNKSHIA